MPREKGGLGDMEIPIIGDITKKLAKDYDCLHKSGVALRATFIIDKNGTLR
jgi:peroxiredoxin (alkyl hydroperoxide reductase subunit C)